MDAPVAGREIGVDPFAFDQIDGKASNNRLYQHVNVSVFSMPKSGNNEG